MPRTARITAKWADGMYDFALNFGELDELEHLTRRKAFLHRDGSVEYQYIGAEYMLNLMAEGKQLRGDIRDTIKCGLIGAGMKPADAEQKVERYVDKTPDVLLNKNVAMNILRAALVGFEIEPLGESQVADGATKESGMTIIEPDASRSPHSTVMRQ